jgi:alpha-glucosidase (family GH31 glycosyl hydrolase)
LRYRLLPYNYTLAKENHETGMPLARPLFIMYPNDTTLANESSVFAWGDAFLVAPVVEAGQIKKDVRLPSGVWINFWTDEMVEGGRTVTIDAPLDRLPLFVKSGSIIPMAPRMNYSDERPLDTLFIHYYPLPDKESSYKLFEDDGKTLDSVKSVQTIFKNSVRRKDDRAELDLTIAPGWGTYDGRPQRRTYVEVIHGVAQAPANVTITDQTLTRRSSYDAVRTSGNGFYFDAHTSQLFIQITVDADKTCSIDAEGVSLQMTQQK